MAIIPVLGRLTQEDREFQACLGYIERPYFKKTGRGRKGKDSHHNQHSHIGQEKERANPF
jgi:hypothetical protein